MADHMKLMADAYITHMVSVFKDITKKGCDDLFMNIKSSVQKNVEKIADQKELYNYDEMPEPEVYVIQKNHLSTYRWGENYEHIQFMEYVKTNKMILKNPCNCAKYEDKYYKTKTYKCHCSDVAHEEKLMCWTCCTKTILDRFQQFVAGEKIVIFQKNKNNEGCCYELLTNYGKYLQLDEGWTDRPIQIHCESNSNGKLVGYLQLNFWIPIDQIEIMKDMPYIGTAYLRSLKNMLNYRKITHLYMMEIINQNAKLIELLEEHRNGITQLSKDRNQLEEDKKVFYAEAGPSLDIIKERNSINELRDKLQAVAKKIKMEKLQLEKEKEVLSDIDLEGFEF
jgi:hypothetical protein